MTTSLLNPQNAGSLRGEQLAGRRVSMTQQSKGTRWGPPVRTARLHGPRERLLQREITLQEAALCAAGFEVPSTQEQNRN